MIFIQPVTPSIFDELEQSRPLIPAPNSRRFVNYVVDNTCAYLLVVLCLVCIGIIGELANADWVYYLWEESLTATAVQQIFGTVVFVSYFTIIEFAMKGRSIGKMITKTIAVSEDGSKITFKQVLIRSICRMIPFEPFGAFANRLWHDRLSKTKVVMNRKY
ncbi:MAG: RDD family protein [Sphingobacteriales bacterium]|nr:MAG: RDD family protein [Sphingobacteriales bacterium]